MTKSNFNNETVIFRASYIDQNGVKHYARDYGKRGFKLVIKNKPKKA